MDQKLEMGIIWSTPLQAWDGGYHNFFWQQLHYEEEQEQGWKKLPIDENLKILKFSKNLVKI